MSDLFTILPPKEADAVRRLPANIERAHAVTQCARRWSGKPQHRCSVGSGDAAYTANSGLDWQRERHVPANFFDFRKRA
jgi:hypothetical protein